MTETDLDPSESELRGSWSMVGREMQADATCRRIEWLIRSRLQRLADADGGWSVLFRDPGDGRLWERTYPHSEMHGGGPPRLSAISEEQAAAKYGRDAL